MNWFEKLVLKTYNVNSEELKVYKKQVVEHDKQEMLINWEDIDES